MTVPVIIEAVRTPIGKMGGTLSYVRPEKLASPLIQHLVEKFQLANETIDDVLLGNVVGPGGNLARLSALEAGLPFDVPGVTVDRQCGSGLEAIHMAARSIQAGAGDIYLAGGAESTSLAPWKFEKPASLYDQRGPKYYSRARFSPESIGDPDMGVSAENVAEKYGITREQQDEYALHSHLKAVHAQDHLHFEEEIVPIENVTRDECPRRGTSLNKLAKLKPVFNQEGTVTAGNACPLNDGAALVLMMSLDKCRELGLTHLCRFVDAQTAGVDPHLLGIGPVPAVSKLLNRCNLTIQDVDTVEFNEAFASQVLASLTELEIPLDKVNLSGGALALGHPYGASGAILVTRLVSEMKRHSFTRGIATMGIGGGMGIAGLFERIEEE
ncbi:thiolase family protein [Halobacillus salinarum]|uniref:Thiolase family protein n=1 Tax=Halobacillus salinarum TaxID=2932257 RepID=A0ABY4ELU2_9BACI|nr:thiolase family protein [Halobacillus salinarum]UOQ45046.1 thiolase family protein [Halobacillus salinarum]